MKVFNLCCDREHAFEGWFASGEAYESQSTRGLVFCPVCNSAAVRKMPAAPHLNFNVARPAPAGTAGAKPATPAQPGGSLDDARSQAIATLRKLIAESEDVGERFAEEARKIHYEETAPRSIRGITSAEERDALQEEGIEVLSVPWPGAPKETLQ